MILINIINRSAVFWCPINLQTLGSVTQTGLSGLSGSNTYSPLCVFNAIFGQSTHYDHSCHSSLDLTLFPVSVV